MSAVDFADALRWLEATPLARAVREDAWIYPALESAHLLGLALLFGSIAAFDLRMLGLTRALPIMATARHLLRLTWIGLALAALSGFGLFASDASRLAANPAFQAKLALVALAGINAAAFHLGPFRAIDDSQPLRERARGARVMALASLLLWSLAIVAGRLIAYL